VQEFTSFALGPMINGTRYLDAGNSFLNNLVVLLALGLVVLVSAFTHRMIEVRFQRIGKSMILKRVKTAEATQPVNL